jgi:hypothetical protein
MDVKFFEILISGFEESLNVTERGNVQNIAEINRERRLKILRNITTA